MFLQVDFLLTTLRSPLIPRMVSIAVSAFILQPSSMCDSEGTANRTLGSA